MGGLVSVPEPGVPCGISSSGCGQFHLSALVFTLPRGLAGVKLNGISSVQHVPV